LPPVEQGRELDSLDSAVDAEAEKQPVKMSLYGSPCHVQLAGNLGVITTLQKQLDNLLFARTEPNGLLLHSYLPVTGFASGLSGAAACNFPKDIASTLPF
jgi:hypothetical protein